MGIFTDRGERMECRHSFHQGVIVRIIPESLRSP